MATQAQIEAALAIQGTYSLISGAASFTDVTNYAGLGIATPDTVKILLYIQDSTGALFYKNAGYDTATFTSPDLEPLLGTDTYSYTLPTDITGAYLQGQYTVNMKVQVVEGGVTVNAFKALYQNITATCNGITVSVAPNVTYNTAIVSVTDNTNYKGYTALTNTLTLYPPPPSGQASQNMVASGSPATLIYQPSPGTYPYTGVWTWTLVSDVTYNDATTGAATTCRLTAQGSFNVVQSQLCKVYCVLKQYRGEVLQHLAQKQTYAQLELDNLVRAEGEYMLAWAASLCGKPQTEIDVYITNIYALINKSPDCACGCDDGTSQPLVPTSIINGIDGTDGSVIYNGSGAPAGGLGVVGDYYIDTATGDLYEKTGASTWTFLMSILGATGPAGPTGATGAAGADGAAVLYNQYPAAVTEGTSWETLETYQLPSGQMSTNGDLINIKARLKAVGTIQNQEWRVQFGGNTVAFGFFNDGIVMATADIWLSRTSNTEAKYEVLQTGNINFLGLFYMVSVGGGYAGIVNSALTTLAGLNFTTTAYDINVDGKSIVAGNSIVAGDVMCEKLQVIYYQLGSANLGAGILYGVPFSTTAAVQSYPNIIGQTGKTIRRVYLDGELLDSADWSYDNTTDTITFIITITATSEVQFDYQ